MNSVLELINNLSNEIDPKQVTAYLNMIHGKSDIIIASAYIKISPNNNNNNTPTTTTTELLYIIESLLSSDQQQYILGISILLSFYADTVDRSEETSFLRICKVYLNRENNNIRGNIQYIYHFLIKIVKKMVKIVCRANQPRYIISVLIKAISIIQPSSYCLTPIHTDILQLFIKGQMYDHAVAFIDNNPILEIDMNLCFISGLDYVRYFYYAGICYIGMKDYTVALDYLNQCISTPTEKMSAVILCAIKKAKLISLIESGTEFSVSP